MNLEINLNQHQQNALAHLASMAGVDVDAFVHQIIEAEISPTEQQSTLSAAEWTRRFESLISRHSATGSPVDDSRDSIYPDRS